MAEKRAACFTNTNANSGNQQGTKAFSGSGEDGHHAPGHHRHRDYIFADPNIRPTGNRYASKGIEDYKCNTAKQAQLRIRQVNFQPNRLY